MEAGALPAAPAGLEAGAFAACSSEGEDTDGTEGTALEAPAAGLSAAGAGALPGTEGTAEPWGATGAGAAGCSLKPCMMPPSRIELAVWWET